MARLTEARRRGLEVLLDRRGRRRLVSFERNAHVGYVYWQTADWLVENGYAEVIAGTAGYCLALTKKGRELARAEGVS